MHCAHCAASDAGGTGVGRWDVSRVRPAELSHSSTRQTGQQARDHVMTRCVAEQFNQTNPFKCRYDKLSLRSHELPRTSLSCGRRRLRVSPSRITGFVSMHDQPDYPCPTVSSSKPPYSVIHRPARRTTTSGSDAYHHQNSNHLD